jgi:lysine biosynthesis protein LysW
MPSTYCPNCDAVVAVSDPHEGAMITCRQCGQELEIISTRPFEVDFPLDYDEDWDDEYDDDDDDDDDQ